MQAAKFTLIPLLFLNITACRIGSVACKEPDLHAIKESSVPSVERLVKADQRRVFDVEAIKDLAYRKDVGADERKHRLDLYLPREQNGFPIVFFVHGGSWRHGDRDEYPKLGEMLAGQGVGAVIISYRLSPSVQHPAHIEDVASAFAWTHRNIEKYGGRKDRIFVMGHSAGGHLVSLLATDDQYLKNEGLDVSNIRGVISISGVYALSPLLPMFRSVFGDREVCRRASPINHVRETHPPFLLLYAERDLPTLGRMADDLYSALKRRQCEAESVRIRNRDHMSILLSLASENDDGRTRIFEFIARHSDWKPMTQSTEDSKRGSDERKVRP